jgi:hypothetical protein
MFPDERACHQYVFKLRWPEGYTYSECGTSSYSWSEVLPLTRKRRNLDGPPTHDLGLRRAGFVSSASRAR